MCFCSNTCRFEREMDFSQLLQTEQDGQFTASK